MHCFAATEDSKPKLVKRRATGDKVKFKYSVITFHFIQK